MGEGRGECGAITTVGAGGKHWGEALEAGQSATKHTIDMRVGNGVLTGM